MVFRAVCVPVDGYFKELKVDLGCRDCGASDRGYMDGKRRGAVSGPFTFQDLPAAWQARLMEAAKNGTGRCQRENSEGMKGFYYFIGKYEVTNFQWRALLNAQCQGVKEIFTADDPRPKTNVSWFEAIDYTRRYNEWLVKNKPESIPKFPRGRFAFLRLPTESEWEYAARGGHMVTESQMQQEPFFPLKGRPISDYAVYTERGAARTPERLAWIGSKCPNPLGLFDTAGNAAEILLDTFRFSVKSYLHGPPGGFIAKGGSYLKRKAEISPGRREEMPFFLQDKAFRSPDLGFRLVLSAIVTPDNRKEALKKEWAAIASTRSRRAQLPTESLSPVNAMLQGMEERPGPGEVKSETLKIFIESALFQAETVVNYTKRRKILLKELRKLKKLRGEILPESTLLWLKKETEKKTASINAIDTAIDRCLKSYIQRIRDCQIYPEGALQKEVDIIFRGLSLEGEPGARLTAILQTFRRHLTLYRRNANNITRDILMKDIISMPIP